MTHFHPFHFVDQSPWPYAGSQTTLMLTTSFPLFIHKNISIILITSMMSILMVSTQWWRDILRESLGQGKHTTMVSLGLKWGMALFIISEIFLFISLFWTFFHSSLSPTPEIYMWPPHSIITFNPFQIPFLNTTILLSSGISVTLAHHSLMSANRNQSNLSLIITIAFGLIFIFLQAFEYIYASYTISVSILGSTFFLMTGFHGLHVLMGSVFLTTWYARNSQFHISSYHYISFELAAWYWHFVDVVMTSSLPYIDEEINDFINKFS